MSFFSRSKDPKPQSAISPLPDAESQYRQFLSGAISWLLIVFAVVCCGLALYSSYKMVTAGEQVELDIVGARTPQEVQMLEQQLKNIKQAHFLQIDLLQIRDAVLKQQWVDEVVVSRAWPKKIQIQVIPRQAVAQWGNTGRWVSDTGDVFSLYYGQGEKNLPILSGSVDQVKDIMRMYQEINYLFYPLGLRVTRLDLTERMTWSMQLSNGVKIVVDQDKTLQKLQHLSAIAQRELKPVLSRIEKIDLRYQNGLAIQWRNAQPARYEKGRFVMRTTQ